MLNLLYNKFTYFCYIYAVKKLNQFVKSNGNLVFFFRKQTSKTFFNKQIVFLLKAKKLEQQFKWISEEKNKFGEPGSGYDFSSYSYESAKKEIEALRDRSKELESMINTRAMQLLGTAEEHVTELL